MKPCCAHSEREPGLLTLPLCRETAKPPENRRKRENRRLCQALTEICCRRHWLLRVVRLKKGIRLPLPLPSSSSSSSFWEREQQRRIRECLRNSRSQSKDGEPRFYPGPLPQRTPRRQTSTRRKPSPLQRRCGQEL